MTTAKAKLWDQCWHNVSLPRRDTWLARRQDNLPGVKCVVIKIQGGKSTQWPSPFCRTQAPQEGTRARFLGPLSLSLVTELLWEALLKVLKSPRGLERGCGSLVHDRRAPRSRGSPKQKGLGLLLPLCGGSILGATNHDPKGRSSSAPVMLGAQNASLSFLAGHKLLVPKLAQDCSPPSMPQRTGCQPGTPSVTCHLEPPGTSHRPGALARLCQPG